jgi:hypothetical protein
VQKKQSFYCKFCLDFVSIYNFSNHILPDATPSVTIAILTSSMNAVIIEATDVIVPPMKKEVRADIEPPTVMIISAENITTEQSL